MWLRKVQDQHRGCSQIYILRATGAQGHAMANGNCFLFFSPARQNACHFLEARIPRCDAWNPMSDDGKRHLLCNISALESPALENQLQLRLEVLVGIRICTSIRYVCSPEGSTVSCIFNAYSMQGLLAIHRISFAFLFFFPLGPVDVPC